MAGRLEGGLTVWFTGLPSAGKTTLARALAPRLEAAGHRVELLDGDAARQLLTRDLGFSRQDREENVRRIGWVASRLARHGVVVLASVISPYRSARQAVRQMHEGRFFEVYVSTPLEICRRRDVKGLYAKAATGQVSALTGVDDPYEPPMQPELVVPAHLQSVEESAELVWQALHSG